MKPADTSHLLVVAAPSETRGTELADALRQMGRNVTLATTPEQAAQAGQYGGTVVVLSPTTRADPTVQAAIDANGARRFPFFTQTLILPFGTWDANPVLFRGSITDAAQRLIAAIDAPPAADVAREAAAALAAKDKQLADRRRLINIIGGAIALLLLIGLVIFVRSGDSTTPASTTAATAPTATAAPTGPVVYSAAAPGSCDQGTATWSLAANAAIACGSDGATLSAKSATSNYLFINFHTSDGTFPSTYQYAVTGKITKGDTNAVVFAGLQQQLPTGMEVVAVSQDGHWSLVQIDNSGKVLKVLKSGKLSGAVTNFKFSVTVDGLGMHVHLNGKGVVSDADELGDGSQAIIFGVADPGSATPFAASFANFTYTPPGTTGS